MSYLLPHLHTGYAVDQAILSVSFGCCAARCVYMALGELFLVQESKRIAIHQEEDRVVIIRFGHDWDQTCMQMDEVTLLP